MDKNEIYDLLKESVNHRKEFYIEQIVHSRKSFMYDEILWGKRFVSIIGQNDEGKTSLALDKMNEMQNAELPLHISLKESQAL
jgi:hypothetical protein